VPY
jgi:hypothetical protein